jgi:hypothetical protein
LESSGRLVREEAKSGAVTAVIPRAKAGIID